jgi:ubiquinone/menaquinone biosynthesis C-methylase UbiE
MNNYQYCVHWMTEQMARTCESRPLRVLDYGCGAGQIVKLLRERQIDASGCDVFYEGGDNSVFIEKDALAQGVIRRMQGDKVPFDDASFDYVINNQVLEHVENIDVVLAEIQRVLKPGGTVLSLFPDKGVWREGHCGVPFLHWFPKQSQVRVWYTAAFRVFGFGYNKENKSLMHWSRFQCEWLDKWTHYRSRGDIHSSYQKYFANVGHIEDHWFRLRVGPSMPMATLLPAALQKFITQKLGFLVMVAQKPV